MAWASSGSKASGPLACESPPGLDVPHDDPRDAGVLLALRPEPPPPRAGVAVLPSHLPPEDPRRRRAEPRDPRGDPRPVPFGEDRRRDPDGRGHGPLPAGHLRPRRAHEVGP